MQNNYFLGNTETIADENKNTANSGSTPLCEYKTSNGRIVMRPCENNTNQSEKQIFGEGGSEQIKKLRKDAEKEKQKSTTMILLSLLAVGAFLYFRKKK